MVANATTSTPTRQRRVDVCVINTGDFRVDGGELYTGAVRTDWQHWNLDEKGKKPVDRKDRVRLSNSVVVIQVPDLPDGQSTISIVGTGIGSRDPIFTRETLGMSGPNRLQRELKREGVKLNQVDRVILPSLHYTMASNILIQDNKGQFEPICPRAEYVIPRSEYEAAMTENPLTRSIYQGIRSDLEMLEKRGGSIRLVEGSEEIGTCISMHEHGGVTTGHSSVIITLGSEKLLVSGLFFPTPNHIAPEIQLGFTMNREETFVRKTELLEKAWQENLLVLCSMDPTQSVGYVHRDNIGNFSFERVGGLAA